MDAKQEHMILFPEAERAEWISKPVNAEPLGADEVSGRTLYTMVSAGTEMNVYLGQYEKNGMTWGRFPFVPGYAAVFEVEQTGDAVSDIKPGEYAFCMGPHRSRQRVGRDALIPLPGKLYKRPELAPLARLMNVTFSTLTTTTARPPEKVVVTGLGAIGLMGALMFQHCGYDVLGCDPDERRRAMAEGAGLKRTCASLPVDDPSQAGHTSLVLECSAHEQAVLDGLAMLEKRGELVLVGVPMVRKTEIYAQEILNRIFRQHVVVRSGSEWEVPRHPAPFRHGSNFGNMTAALRWLGEGAFRLDDLFTIIPPNDPQTVFQDLLHRRQEKIVCFDWAGV